MNFFGVAALIGMLDLAAASFNIAVFARMITRPPMWPLSLCSA